MFVLNANRLKGKVTLNKSTLSIEYYQSQTTRCYKLHKNVPHPIPHKYLHRLQDIFYLSTFWLTWTTACAYAHVMRNIGFTQFCVKTTSSFYDFSQQGSHWSLTMLFPQILLVVFSALENLDLLLFPTRRRLKFQSSSHILGFILQFHPRQVECDFSVSTKDRRRPFTFRRR